MGSRGTKLIESERGVWFSWNRYCICTPRFNRKNELIVFRGRKTVSASAKFWSLGCCMWSSGSRWRPQSLACRGVGEDRGEGSATKETSDNVQCRSKS